MSSASKSQTLTIQIELQPDGEYAAIDGQLLIVYTGDRDPGGHRMSVLYRKKR